MASVMVFTAAPALNAEAATKKLGSRTVYLESADFGSSFSIDVNKGTSIKNMKSSNKNVVKPYYYRINKNIMVNDDGKESSANNNAYAYFRAASGWKVVYMDAYNSTDKYYADFYRSWNNGTSKWKLTFTDYKTNQYGSVGIRLRNKKDNGEIYVSVSLNAATK